MRSCSTFVNQKTGHKLIIKHTNSNKEGREIQGYPNLCYASELNQPNLALGKTIKTLQPLYLFIFMYF